MDAIFTKDDPMEHTPEPVVPLENSMEANDDNSVQASKTDCDETTNTEVIICEVSRLKQENETLRSNMTCKICLDARVGKLFLPCRHLVCCEECSASSPKMSVVSGTYSGHNYNLLITVVESADRFTSGVFFFRENTYGVKGISKVLGRVS